ncbi:MAG: pyroglutamyl-peptidase I [Sulfolobaceae archaeon]|nr:pyroglutamyl-peptidase I [Sulfolobaceae archaeon]
MTVLLFGFEKFSDYPENPSELIVKSLNGEVIEDEKVVGIILPVEYNRIEKLVTQAIEQYRPKLILGIGLAPGRSKITPEKIAINYKYAKIPDNAGMSYRGELIDPMMPDGIFSNLPVEELVEYLNTNNIPSEISLSAGAYICNLTMFIIMREAKKIGAKGGFIHVPCHERLAVQHNCPSMSLDMMIKAIKLAIKFYLKKV